jgi:hypothetical protein
VLSDEELRVVTRYGAEERRLVDAVCAVAAGQLARHSAREPCPTVPNRRYAQSA